MSNECNKMKSAYFRSLVKSESKQSLFVFGSGFGNLFNFLNNFNLEMEKIEMNVNRELIDANFEGYKLSLDPIPTYSTTYKPLQQVTPADDQVRIIFI